MASHETMNKKLKLIYGGMFLTNEKMQISIKKIFDQHQESLEPCEAERVTWT